MWIWCLNVISVSFIYFGFDLSYWLISGPTQISGWSRLTNGMTRLQKAGINFVIETIKDNNANINEKSPILHLSVQS